MTDTYRKEMRNLARQSTWTIWRFLPVFVLVVAALGVVGFTALSLGLIGGTIVERKVFENSYQRDAALKERIATDEAVLAEIERKLSNQSLEGGTRTNLEAQASAARVRIQTARTQQ